MVNKFRMCGRTVQLYRWRVDYEENGEPVTEQYPTEPEADAAVRRTGGVKSAIDVTGNEWIDGMEVSDVSQPMTEALRIYSEGQAALIRQQRNTALEETDWTQLSDAPFTDEEREKIRAYRQSLRDLPQQSSFPINCSFPVRPTSLITRGIRGILKKDSKEDPCKN